ncbi:hypothetical protein [Ornithinibacillus sp. FSL M8-0202]|uniref:hypothetical protein n=1 Tax=Ornithinibacillus sp. FSL M8-0202 TaxID=2921616 RepID=UPI0030CB168A
MFDTVKFGVPIHLSQDEIEQVEWTRTNTSINKQRIDTSPTIFKTLRGDELQGEPVIHYTYKEFEPSKSWLKVELSIPKFLNGTNVYELGHNDIDVLNKVIRKYLSIKLKLDLSRIPFLESYTVEKVHICKNFYVGNNVKHYLKALTSLTIPKYKRREYTGTGTGNFDSVEWIAKKRKEKVYDKKEEVMQQKDYESKKRHVERAKGILRYEIELSDADIRSISPGRKATDVLRPEVATKFLQKGLIRNGLSSGVRYSSLQDILDLINKQLLPPRTKSALIAYVTEIYFYGEDICREKYSKSIYYERKKQIRDILGLDEILIGEVILPPLSVGKEKRLSKI